MNYFPIPVDLLEIGKPLPVDIWSASGSLLLRKGQPVQSEEHREKLHAHHASATYAEATAWQRAYERLLHTMLSNGADVQEVARLTMPSEIRESDYIEIGTINGGWLDLQAVLRGILYQGGLALNPLNRLAGIEQKAIVLADEDADDSLFCLFQALPDDSLGYCATHALLCAVISHLATRKLGIGPQLSQSLFNAALTMNIGMARDQDAMTRQSMPPTEWQHQLIKEHPLRSVNILRNMGVDDPDQLDLVRWHHDPESAEGLAHTLTSRNLLAMTDAFVARMAARKSRASIPPVKAVRAMVLGAEGDAIGMGSALAQAIGFYPPGTYVRLVNGETALSVQRGVRANTPWVISIADKDGVSHIKHQCYDTAQPSYTIEAPVSFEKVRVTVTVERVRKARTTIAHHLPG